MGCGTWFWIDGLRAQLSSGMDRKVGGDMDGCKTAKGEAGVVRGWI